MRRIGQLIIVALLIVSGCAGETAAGAPVSDALRRDAESYAQAHDVSLGEAIRRLKQQDPVGELNAVLQEQETDAFGGLWIQHEPVYKVVVLVTRGQRRIERRYVRGGPLADVAEVWEAEWTLETLTAAQIELMQILEAVGSRAQTGIDVRGNCVALYTTDPGSLLTTIDAAGLTLPGPVCIVDTGPYAEAPPVDPPPGIVFPRQHPPEGLKEEMTALLIGTLVEEDGCLRVGDENRSHLIIWPYDHTVTAAADGTLQFRNGSGAVVARVGDVVRMGGGETHSLDSVTPMEVPARCTGPYWIAGSQIEGVNLQELPDHPDIAPLLRALRTQGYALGEPEESQAAFLQPEPGIAYRLDEHSWLHVHLFPDEQAAQVRADSIPHEMSNSIVDWVAPPHFYRCGRVIALYLGANEDVEVVLDGSLRGPEHCQLIAGSVEIAVVDAAFSNAEAAMSAYEHPPTEAGGVVEALNGDCARWLSDGGEPEALEDTLRRLPRLESADLAVTLTDLNGDGLSDVVVEPRFIGLAVLGCLASQDGAYICQPLPAPAAFGVNRLTMRSGILSRDLIGDGRPETVVTYTLQGGSGWRELLYVFRWPQPAWSEQVFRATLINWAGRSTWRLEQDPNSRQRSQIVLTYPQLYPIDHKMLNHPLGRQIWRWDGEVGQFALAERTVDLEQSAWGTEREITVEDRLRWLANEGETAFRYAEYEEALAGYGEALTFAEAQGWRPADDEPDWVGFLRFRRAQVLAYLGQIDAARSGMLRLTTDYEGDLLGELARAFLSGHGDGDEEEAAAEAHAALLRLEERVRDHFYHERQGALRFPIQGAHLLCCAPGTRVLTASDGWQQALDICVGGPSVAQETCDPTEIPTDVTAWDAHSLPHVDVTVPVPPGWVIQDRGEVGDTVYGVTFQPPVWDSPAECGYQCPEISAVIYRDPVTATASGVEAVRTWLERRATTEPFGADVDDSVKFFGVEQIEETTLAGRPALGFHHDAMGIRVYTTLTLVDESVVSLSKTHVGQFEFEPVFEMMQTHTTVRETITDIP